MFPKGNNFSCVILSDNNWRKLRHKLAIVYILSWQNVCFFWWSQHKLVSLTWLLKVHQKSCKKEIRLQKNVQPDLDHDPCFCNRVQCGWIKIEYSSVLPEKCLRKKLRSSITIRNCFDLIKNTCLGKLHLSSKLWQLSLFLSQCFQCS